MSDVSFNGIITKAVGGNYYVEAQDGDNVGVTFKCAARGIFRNKGLSPAAGDFVTVCADENTDPVVTEIHERKNFLIRPPLANLDIIVFVNSTTQPAVNTFILDQLIAVADSKNIETIIVFTKIDLNSAENFPDIYRKIGIPVFSVDNTTGSGTEKVRAALKGKISAFIGNSGVGKSSLLNNLYPELQLETSHISKKLGRGRHTTRQVELFKKDNGYIADTPGFSTVDIGRYCNIPANSIDSAFREFGEFLGKCGFADCVHIKEKGCAVKSAVENGDIARSRYESYLRMFEEAKKVNEWDKKNL